MEDKTYFTPGMTVLLKQDIPNKPIMVVIKKETPMLKHNSENKGNMLKGIRCMWFTNTGERQEAVFNTKDLIVIQ